MTRRKSQTGENKKCIQNTAEEASKKATTRKTEKRGR
jgi:hypothetical protein